MMKRLLIGLVVFMAVSVFAEPKPNVVVLFVDDLGWKDIGCYGGPAKTPNLDKLAAKGIKFTDFHAGCAVCSPSRAVLMTGRHHFRAGVYNVINIQDHKMHLLEREVTIAEILKNAGYSTVHLGKWHMGMPNGFHKKPSINDHGFDYWFGMTNGAHPSHKNPVNFLRNGKKLGKIEGYSCQIIVDEAIVWLEKERKPGKPFFFNVWFHEPHSVIAAPAEIVKQYGDVNDAAAIYTGTVDNTDRAIGRLVAKLNEINELDNTIIVYSSDNGSYRPDRAGVLRGKKGSNFEGGHRVPGIIHWPAGIKGGRVEDEPAGMVDLLPTICGLLNIDKPKGVHLDGSDITPVLKGKKKEFKRHQPLFWLRPEKHHAMLLRDGKYTLMANLDADLPNNYKKQMKMLEQVREILTNDPDYKSDGLKLWTRMFNGTFKNKEAEKIRREFSSLSRFQESMIAPIKKGKVGRVELYDLSKDLGQKKNIAAENPEVTARMKKKMEEIFQSVMKEAPDW